MLKCHYLCRRPWDFARRYQLICAYHHVQLLPAGRPWAQRAEVLVVEEVHNDSADGKTFLWLPRENRCQSKQNRQSYAKLHNFAFLSVSSLSAKQGKKGHTSLSQIKYLLVVLGFEVGSNKKGAR